MQNILSFVVCALLYISLNMKFIKLCCKRKSTKCYNRLRYNRRESHVKRIIVPCGSIFFLKLPNYHIKYINDYLTFYISIQKTRIYEGFSHVTNTPLLRTDAIMQYVIQKVNCYLLQSPSAASYDFQEYIQISSTYTVFNISLPVLL